MRVGRIGYINCYPVYGGIDRGVIPLPAGLVTGTPSELTGLLAAGELDVSVVSAVEYARNARDYVLLPDLAISCDGPVRSVALFSRRTVGQLDGRTVLLSASSRTSIALLELLCGDVWKVRPHFAEARAEAGDLESLEGLPHDAVLVIGDAALLLAARHAYPYRYDLGEEWKGWTGMPFVFAVWAARRSSDLARVRRIHQALLASRAWGLSHLDQLADAAALTCNVRRATCLQYLAGLDYALSYKHLEGYVLSFDQIGRKIDELRALGGVQILIQGGHNPYIPFAWYLDLMRYIKRHHPIHIHGFSPSEIDFFAGRFGMTLEAVIRELVAAGLDSVPGGGGEILVQDVRDRVAKKKAGADRWLEVMETAHRLGLKTSVTMMYGLGETAADRIEHLFRVREVQARTGGFTALICWPLQPEHTALEHLPQTPP